MSPSTSREFERLLAGHTRGAIALTDLPLGDEDFWRFLFARAAHPGRSSRTHRPAAAAERLLVCPLEAPAERARQRAATRSLASSDRYARRQAMRFLQEADVDMAGLEAVIRAVHDHDPEVRIQAVRLLAKYPSGLTMPALLDVLATAFDSRETLAAEELVLLGEAAAPGLAALLDDEDARIRWRAALCLTKIASRGTTKALPALLKAFHDDSPDVAWVAADGLLSLGPGTGTEVLRSVLAERLTPVTNRALHHYAGQAAPARVFRPLREATRGTAVVSATLAAVDEALKALRPVAQHG